MLSADKADKLAALPSPAIDSRHVSFERYWGTGTVNRLASQIQSLAAA